MWASRFSSQKELAQYLIKERGIANAEVCEVLKKVDRALFITQGDPYQDSPLPLFGKQTISAPHMHAMCLDLLAEHLKPGNSVLDVGCGSGYLTACFAELVGKEGKVWLDSLFRFLQFSLNFLSNFLLPFLKRLLESMLLQSW